MADEPTTPPQDPAATTPPAPAATEPTGQEPTDLGDAGKKAIEREREARKTAEKSARELAAKVKEFEDRDKSETQRMADELAQLREDAGKARREALVTKVAMAHKLDAEDIDLLHGDTEDELVARAARIQALKAHAPAGPGSVDQGAKPPKDNDINVQIRAAEAKGDIATAMRLKNSLAASLIANT